jgi:endogenous inhibitor of DNA gyrase (YacG/DUF329 family)
MTESKALSNLKGSVVMLGKCPICKKRATLDYRPFCSKHCSDVDFSRWIGGNYAIPVEETEDLEAMMAELEKDQ